MPVGRLFFSIEADTSRLQQSVPATETLPTREEFRLEAGDALSVDWLRG